MFNIKTSELPRLSIKVMINCRELPGWWLLLVMFFVLPGTANALELENIDGSKQDIKQLTGQGRWVVMNVWSPSCAFCVQELPHLQAFHQKHSDAIDVIGLTLDYPSFEYGKLDVIKRFLSKHPIAYPLYLADHAMASEVIGSYLKAIPLLVIFHPDGRVLGRWPGEINIPELEEFIRSYGQYGTEDWGLDS